MREAVALRKDFIFTPDGEWDYLNNYINASGRRDLLKRGSNNRYRIEMYYVDTGYRIVFLDKREKANMAAALPFDMKSMVTHHYSYGCANMKFRKMCKEYGIESCEVSKFCKWLQKYD